MKVLNELTDWQDVKVSVSVTDLVELLLASHSDVDFIERPHTSKVLVEVQDTIREAIYESGYWTTEEE